MGRSSSRFRVHLYVRYASAAEFVREYAENLSAGGMFIAGATGLAPRERVPVEIELPGAGSHRVEVEVAHVLDEEVASRFGRAAGAGVAIVQSPPEFDQALRDYLARLGRRVDQRLLVQDLILAEELAEAGYTVEPAPAPDQLVAAIARAAKPVLAVLVGAADADAYRQAARVGGDPELVQVVGDEPVDVILTILDAEL